ncbi:RPE-retinal G protein-coupled receptor [Bos mutus]|uniref:RPE-retinal G protein-coupled receptor n=1 Tax=Bos mutus TaxID=72004 RepID=UPI0038B61A5F
MPAEPQLISGIQAFLGPDHQSWLTVGTKSLGPATRLPRRWPYGSEGCQAHGFQGFVTALASICSSAAVAWGRYHHFCTRSRLDWNTAVSLVFFVWLSSAFWAALPLLGWGHYDYEPLGTCCTLDYSRGDRNFTSFLFTMAFFNFLLPLFITVVSYRLMEQKLGKTSRPPVRISSERRRNTREHEECDCNQGFSVFSMIRREI